ncbi:centrosomal protein of 135 kDa isoform X2 [Cimex lectularius]|uniref:Centrosomal protein of 135 kDa n=1 Tax=Cimex lectularius TaxID=79782 RepID=A0A8I6S9N2_CIMLE|nr:centrosomal protein of 135 kDa isoform X2 [Cimex lectularius]
MGLKEKKFLNLREKLDRLGYSQPLSVDSVLLVEKLLYDLDSFKKQLDHYKNSAIKANSKCDSLELTLLPYKRDNERLIRENNELHHTILKQRDEAEKSINKLKSQLIETENAYSDLEFAYMEQLTNVGELHQDILLKNEKLLTLDNTSRNSAGLINPTIGKNYNQPSPKKQLKQRELQKKLRANLRTVTSVNNYISNVLDGKSRSEGLDELEKLKRDNCHLMDEVELCQNQVKSRDREIERLSKIVEKRASPIVYHHSTCNCHCFEDQDLSLLGDNSPVLLKKQLEEATLKQHQAMKRATDLMDRVKVLENKLVHLEARNIQREYNSSEQTKEKRDCSKHLEDLKIMEMEKSSLKEQIEELRYKNTSLEEKCSSLLSENHSLNNRLKQIQLSGTEDANFKECQQKHAKPKKQVVQQQNHRECSCGCCCDHKYTHENEYKFEGSESDHPLCSHKNVLKILNKEKARATDELNKLQDELIDYKNKLAGLSQAMHSEKCNNEVIKLQLEDKIKSYELEKKSLSDKISSLNSKLQMAEHQIDKLRHEVDELTTDSANWKAKYNHIKVLNEHLEMTIKNSEENEKSNVADIKSSMIKIQQLEKEKAALETALQTMQKEKVSLRNDIHHLDKEKDSLMTTLDEKAVQLSKMETAMKQKNNYVSNMEKEISNLQAQVHTLERMLSTAESKARSSNNDIRKIEAELTTLESCKENLIYENRRLQNDLAALTQDNMQMSGALAASKQEVENLKMRLQTYVEEVRRVDELLQMKENERAELLEQFKALSAEASHLEVNNQSLEYESTKTKETLRDTTDRVQNLEWEIGSKNSLVQEMEGKLESHLDRLKQDKEKLELRVAEDQRNQRNLQDVLTSSRQEAMEKSLYTHDLRFEVEEMQQTVHSLENKLTHLTKTLSDCQRSCENYREENIKLKRDLTNREFERTRAEDSASFSTSL